MRKGYYLDQKKLENIIKSKRYENIMAFAEAHHINRATLRNYYEKGPIAEPYYRLCDILQIDPLSLLVCDQESSIAPVMDLANGLCDVKSDMAVLLIGSRASGKFTKNSDWDLAVTSGEHELDTDTFLQLKNKLSDLAEDFPQFVDLVNLDQAPAWFLEAMDYKPLFVAGNPLHYQFFLGVLDGIQKKRKTQAIAQTT